MANSPGGVQYDAAKQLYYVDQAGKRVYISPVAFGGEAPTGGGVFHGTPSWNTQTGQFDQGLNWGNILSLVVAGVMTAGVADAIMSAPAGTAQALLASGGPSAGTGGVEAGATAGVTAGLPGSLATVPALGTEGALAGTVGPAAAAGLGGVEAGATSGLGPGIGTAGLGALDTLPGMPPDVLPSRQTVPNVGLAPGSTGSTPGGGWSEALRSLLTNPNVLRALTGVGGALAGRALAQNAAKKSVPPELQQLLDLSMERARLQQPLFRQTISGISQMLPTFATPNPPGGPYG